ncbi:MAG: phosphatase PAP2 family protein [Nitrospiraceae bacterium]
MTSVHLAVTSFFNQFVQRSWTFDAIMVYLASSNLAKGYIVLPLFWWAWFREDRNENRHAMLVTLLMSCIVAVALSQLAQYKPLRVRPLFTPELHLKHAEGLQEWHYSSWSAFPSDHATFFFSFAVGFYFISRILGWLALAHAVIVISFPRVYLGLHYLTDVVAGAILGGSVTYACCTNAGIRTRLGSWTARWERTRPATLYTGLFVLTTQMTYLFYDVHELGQFLYDLIKGTVEKLLH